MKLVGVAGDSDEVIEALEQLVLKSLVAVDTSGQTPRYRLLDTTRAYASAKLLETGMAGEVRRRHARYYLDWLTRSTDVAVAPVEHTSNIRAALEWAFSSEGDVEIGVGLATYACEIFLRQGMLTESRRWSERGLETSLARTCRLTPGNGASSRRWARHDDHGGQCRRRARVAGSCASHRGRAGRSPAAVSPAEQHAFLPPSHRCSRRIVSDCGTRRENCPAARQASRRSSRQRRCWAWPITSRAISRRRIAT